MSYRFDFSARIGVMGCGDWGRNYVRLTSEFGVLNAVADIDPSVAARTADEFGCKALEPDSLINSTKIDAVIVAVPPLVQGQIALQVLQSGKHLLVEKPMALNIDLANQIVAAKQASGQIAMVGHLMRFHPAVGQMQQMISLGGLGSPVALNSIRTGPGKLFPGTSVLWDIGSHDLSIAIGLLGSAPDRVDPAAISGPNDDAARMTVLFPRNVTLTANMTRGTGERSRIFEVHLQNGSLHFDDMQPWAKKLSLRSPESQRHARYLDLRPELPLTAQIRHFLHCIEHIHQPISDVTEGLDVVWAIQQASEPIANQYGAPQDRLGATHPFDQQRAQKNAIHARP